MSSWLATIPMAVLEFWPLHGFKAAGSFPAWPIDGKGWTLPALTLLTLTLPSTLLPTPPTIHLMHWFSEWGVSFTDVAEIIESLDPKRPNIKFSVPSATFSISCSLSLIRLTQMQPTPTPPPLSFYLTVGSDWLKWNQRPPPLNSIQTTGLSLRRPFSPPEHVTPPLWRRAGTNYLMLRASLPNQSITL